MEIPQTEYDELMRMKSQHKILSEDNKNLIQETKNKAIALDGERSKRKSIEESNLSLTSEIDSLNSKHSEEMSKFNNFEEIKSGSDKWTEHEGKLVKERGERIESYKKDLGEDFMEKNSSFLDGLPEDKIETFLSQQVGNKENNNPDFKSSGDNKQDGDKQELGDFEKAKGEGSIDGMLGAIDFG